MVEAVSVSDEERELELGGEASTRPSSDRWAPVGVVPWSMQGVPGAERRMAEGGKNEYLEDRLETAALIMWRHLELFGKKSQEIEFPLRLPRRAWVENEVRELREILDTLELAKWTHSPVIVEGLKRRGLFTSLRLETLTALNIPWSFGFGKTGRGFRTQEDADAMTAHPREGASTGSPDEVHALNRPTEEVHALEDWQGGDLLWP